MEKNILVYPSQPKVTRLNNGKPIINPTSNWWESGATFNPAAIYVENNPQNEAVIHNLLGNEFADDPRTKDGIVASLYRARPKEDESHRPFTRSSLGLAVFSPGGLELIKRFDRPVIAPDEDKEHYDYVGAEDSRLSFLDGEYYCLYCGVGLLDIPRLDWSVKAQLCLAKSKDLINWTKLGPLTGNVNTKKNNNKDGAIFPEKINGHYFMLHRPCYDNNLSTYAIALAMSDNLLGPWEDMGVIKKAEPNPVIAKHIWVGAGSVPIPVGDKKFIVIYHRGHILNSGSKWYDLHADLFNFNNFDPHKPANIIEKCLEKLLAPETPYERESISREGVANVVFTCGSYEYNGDIYILYGGADSCTLAAKVRKDELLDAIENSERVSFIKTT
jgi:predicted GH43/DUF377 family glycosyl hydrolase